MRTKLLTINTGGTTVDIYGVSNADKRLPKILKPFKAEKGMSWALITGTMWIVAYIGDEPVGVVAVSPLKNNNLRFKSDVVLAGFRRRGIYKALCSVRMHLARKMAAKYGSNIMSAYAGSESINQYLRDGFSVQSTSDLGVNYVVLTC